MPNMIRSSDFHLLCTEPAVPQVEKLKYTPSLLLHVNIVDTSVIFIHKTVGKLLPNTGFSQKAWASNRKRRNQGTRHAQRTTGIKPGWPVQIFQLSVTGSPCKSFSQIFLHMFIFISWAKCLANIAEKDKTRWCLVKCLYKCSWQSWDW